MYYITEFLSGGLITVLFSYAASLYVHNPSYIKIIAFLWGIPVLYFYILFISFSINENVAFDITWHAIYGICCSIFAMFSTLLLMTYLEASYMKSRYIIGYNVFLIVSIINCYIYFRLYDL